MGDNPNPDWSPTKPEQEIWSVACYRAPAKRLTEGHAPTISPRGDTVAFLRGGQIFLMKPAGEDVKNVITQKRNSIRVGLVAGWKHARVRQRAGAVSFIGLYSRADNTLRFLDASVDKDTSPIWSPDGNQIASFAA